jgi:general secretion pathway protein M
VDYSVMVQLSPGQSRALAVVLLFVALAIAFTVVVSPLWRGYQQHQAELEHYRERIERLSRVAANREGFAKHLQQLEGRRDLSRYVLTQRSETLAAAALQEQLKRIVESSGGRLNSTRTMPAQSAGDFLKVSVSARMSVNTDALRQVLYDLESNVPYLMVDKLTVRSRRGRRATRSRRPTPTPSALAHGPLDVRFDLTGFMLADTS